MAEENKEKNMMTIIAQDGTEEEVEVIIAFKFKDTNKEYIIYTKNERDDKYCTSQGSPRRKGVRNV